MHYELMLSVEARDQLRALPKSVRRKIGRRLEALQEDLSGGVKKLTAHQTMYRLRVGTYRVLFQLEGKTIFVYAVKHRSKAYG